MGELRIGTMILHGGVAGRIEGALFSKNPLDPVLFRVFLANGLRILVQARDLTLPEDTSGEEAPISGYCSSENGVRFRESTFGPPNYNDTIEK